MRIDCKILPNKKKICKAILKPVWTYGIQLWGFQSKTLRFLIGAPWYVANETIHRDLKISTVKEEISKFSNRYNIRVNNHQNPLVTQLLFFYLVDFSQSILIENYK